MMQLCTSFELKTTVLQSFLNGFLEQRKEIAPPTEVKLLPLVPAPLTQSCIMFQKLFLLSQAQLVSDIPRYV